MTNYLSAKARVQNCKTVADCERLMVSFDRLLAAGVLTAAEFIRLDGLIIHKLEELAR